jgi:hypothetical protein
VEKGKEKEMEEGWTKEMTIDWTEEQEKKWTTSHRKELITFRDWQRKYNNYSKDLWKRTRKKRKIWRVYKELKWKKLRNWRKYTDTVKKKGMNPNVAVNSWLFIFTLRGLN